MKGYSNAKFKGFPTQHEANLFLQEHKTVRTTSSLPDRSRNRTVAELDEDVKHNYQQQQQAQPVSNNNKRRKLDSQSTTTNVTESTTKSMKTSTNQTPTINDDINNNNILQRKISIQINFDGGSRGNPGIAGAGAEIIIRYIKVVEILVPSKQNGATSRKGTTNSKKEIIERRKKIHYRYYLGGHNQKFTNNQAEYQGVICGIRRVIQELRRYQNEQRQQRQQLQQQQQRQQQQQDNYNDLSSSSSSPYNNDVIIPVNIVIQGDSKLIIQQLKGAYQCKSQNIIPYYNEYQDCMKELLLLMDGKNTNTNNNKMKTKTKEEEIIIMKINSITYEHVYRHDNKIADGKF